MIMAIIIVVPNMVTLPKIDSDNPGFSGGLIGLGWAVIFGASYALSSNHPGDKLLADNLF